MNKISAVVLTKNSRKFLEQVLKSLERLDEVVVLDNGSTDDTLEIAKCFCNVSIHHHPFMGFGKMRQLGASLAKNDWILSIDSDEIASSLLIDEILSNDLNDQKVYSFGMHNYYRNRRIYGCGWGGERFAGFYHRQVASFDDHDVHEKLVHKGGKNLEEVALKGHVDHYSFNSASDFIRKIDSYSDLYVRQNLGKRSSSPLKALLRALWSFFRSYVLKRGFLDGYEGFVISSYGAQGVFWKYIKLYEASHPR